MAPVSVRVLAPDFTKVRTPVPLSAITLAMVAVLLVYAKSDAAAFRALPALSFPAVIVLAAPFMRSPPVAMVNTSVAEFIVMVETAEMRREFTVLVVTLPGLAATVMLSVAAPAVSKAAE